MKKYVTFILFILAAFIMTGCDKIDPTIHILPWEEAVFEGDTFELEWELSDPTLLVEWTSTDDTLATVDQGSITAIAQGMVTIRATIQDSTVFDEVTIVIQAHESTTYSILSPIQTLQLPFQGEHTFLFTVEPENHPVILSTIDSSILEIEGLTIRAIKEGSTTVRATLVDTLFFVDIEVTVDARISTHTIENEQAFYDLFSSEWVYDGDRVEIMQDLLLDESINMEKSLHVVLVEGSITFTKEWTIAPTVNVIIESMNERTISGEEMTNLGSLVLINIESPTLNVQVGSHAVIRIDEHSWINRLIAIDQANDVTIELFGTVQRVDMVQMNLNNNEEIQLHILHYGKILDLLDAIGLSANASTVNTTIQINQDTQPFLFEEKSEYTLFDVQMLGHLENHVMQSPVGERTYFVQKTDVTQSLEQILMDRYIPIGEIQEIILYTKISGVISDQDFEFLHSEALPDLVSLNLSHALIENNHIPTDAMRGKMSLEKVMFPDTLVSIGEYAFYETSIQSVSIPLQVNTIGVDAFGYSRTTETYVKEVHLPHPTPLMQEFAYGFSPRAFFFVPEESLEEYRLRWGVLRKLEPYVYRYYDERLFKEAFQVGDYFVREVTDGIEITLYYQEVIEQSLIPTTFMVDGVELPTVSIGDYAFHFAKNSTQRPVHLVFPDTVKTIGDYAFYEFSIIASLDLANIEIIGASAFEYIQYTFTTLQGLEVHTLKTHAFTGMRNILVVDFPKLVFLGDFALQNFVNIKELYFPQLRHLGSGSISNGTLLETVTLGSVEECGSWVIGGLNNIKVWSFMHDLDEVIHPSFGAGWKFPSTVTVYVHANAYDYFKSIFPDSNIVIGPIVEE